MSRNRRHSATPASPRAPGVYPSPEERERIKTRREKLLRQLILTLVSTGDQGDKPQIESLIREYGAREVQRVLEIFQRHVKPNLIGDDAASYRAYRLAFARFGGRRPFLSEAERGRFQMEQMKSMLPRDPFGADLPASPREVELNDLLLTGDPYWDDITPPDFPPRPADFAAPEPGLYAPPARDLLTWGWDIDPKGYIKEAFRVDRWQPALADLARMALDPGLLHGWPGEKASWAPYHAVHLLGHLQAHIYAAPLLALLDEPNDWLSDCLPANWGMMGEPAEAPLWAYADDRRHQAQQRAVSYSGLAQIATVHPQRRADLLRGFLTRLENSLPFDRQLNGYLVYILDHQLQAYEARAALEVAYQQKRIDLNIMRPEDVNILNN